MTKILLKALELLLSQLLGKVDIPALRIWIEHSIIKLKTVVVILTDDEKDNKKQLRMFWKAIEDDFKNESLEGVIQVIDAKVQDPKLKELIIEMLKEAIEQNKNTALGMKGLTA